VPKLDAWQRRFRLHHDIQSRTGQQRSSSLIHRQDPQDRQDRQDRQDQQDLVRLQDQHKL
jgi:hypothetical protein